MLRRFIMGLLVTNTRAAVARFLVLAALAAALAACGHNDDDAGAKAPAPTTTGAPTTTAAAGDQGWERVVPGGDCQCSDGSEFSFWVREANPEKVVFFFQDGGACFSAETCAPESDLYNTTITEGPGEGGIFDFADERNPFADYSVVFVPYCTGDVHIGNATTEYAAGLTIQHKGYVNGTAALDHLAATFPGATDVVVMGESAGSVASPLYAGLVSDRLPRRQDHGAAVRPAFSGQAGMALPCPRRPRGGRSGRSG
jgi:Pectinacetylesterase